MANVVDWRDRPVLVTGGSGFLGGWLVQALLEREADVVVLLRDEDPRSRLTPLRNRVRVARGCLEDLDLLKRVLARYGVVTVFHLGAQALVGLARLEPLQTFTSNIQGTWNVLEACRQNSRVAQIVLASSDKAYGHQPQELYREDSRLDGLYPYDVSKSCADLLARCYHATYRLPVVVTRCGNFFGGGDLNFSRIVPGTIRSVLAGRPPVIRSNGQYVRDYLYIEDAVAAYLHLAEALMADPALAGEAFNFSFERPLTVLELTRRILETAGRPDLEPQVLDLP
ncbi:MAG: NAD-dependent epimerase/dehydratase family protein, partial [Candidatus Eremiobacterota bacterium]